MIVSMLEAISSMLNQTDVKETQYAGYLVRADCAKMMLDKVIEGMREKGVPDYPGVPTAPTGPGKTAKKPREDEIQVVVEHGKITNVLYAKEDTQLELDGKVYPWQECIGKSFSSGRVV